ncbi:hypothetical protein D3C80_1341700 [compost metagenome]
MLLADRRDLCLLGNIERGLFDVAFAMGWAQVCFPVLAAVDQRLDVIQIPLLAYLDFTLADMANTLVASHDPVANLSRRTVIVGLANPLINRSCHGRSFPRCVDRSMLALEVA